MNCILPFEYILVLIESDWNLKRVDAIKLPADFACINRIRLEFKVQSLSLPHSTHDRINRIRLEFKAYICGRDISRPRSINRIRLEFKEDSL